jgi:hypothetical protein
LNHRGDPFYPPGNPRQDREQDQQRRAAAQARRPLISKWEPDLPTGYIHVDDAIEYMRRRWGKMLRAEVLENFSRDETGPKYVMMGDWPDKSRGERYYMFEDIDLWVYRTMAGVPAGWRDIRRLPKGQRSTVPTRRIEFIDAPPMEFPNGEEPSNGRTGIEEDGRRRDQGGAPADSDGG